MLVVEEPTNDRLNLVLLAVAGVGARIGDDGAATGDDRGILDEAAVGVLLESGKHRDVNAALLESMLVVVVLLDGALVNGLAELRRARDAVAKRLAGTTDDDVAELGHDEVLLGKVCGVSFTPSRWLYSMGDPLFCILYTIMSGIYCSVNG